MLSGIVYMYLEDFVGVNLIMGHIGFIVRQVEKGTCKERSLGHRYQLYRICRYLC